MKLLPILTIACCTIIAHSSELTRSREEGNLRERASAQLERLAPYRRSGDGLDTQSTIPQESPNAINRDDALRELLLVQIYRQVPEELREEVLKGIGRKNSDLLHTLTEPASLARMDEKIKRSGIAYGGYGHDSYGGDEYGGGGYGHPSFANKGSGSGGIISGSGSIISGIAGGILGGIASASAGASKGALSGLAHASAGSSASSSDSSKYKDTPTYGHSYSNDNKHFDVWDFKKAIINTLVQAIKAISGGVIALKGQLIKGSGFLVSTKGRLISSTGEAISSLGRQIAKSAVVTNAPKHPEYSYGPPDHHDDDANTYDGPPPPSAEDYGHDDYSGNSHYGAPSDDGDDHAGLLIVKPTEPDCKNHESPAQDLDPRKPHLTHTQSDYGSGPTPETHDEHQEISGPDHSYNHKHPDQENHADPYHLTQPPTSYDVPLHYPNKEKDASHYPLYPPLQQDSYNLGNHQQTLYNFGNHQQDSYNLGIHQQDSYNLENHQQASYNQGNHQEDAYNFGNHLAVQQSVEYPPIHIQQIEYALPNKNAPFVGSVKPHKDVSVYSSLSIGLNPDLASLKISPLAHGNGFELPKFQSPENFHSSLGQGPLKIPLLNPMPANYWYGHGFMQPATGFALHRRRTTSSQKRRRLGEDSSVRNSMSASRNTRAQRA